MNKQDQAKTRKSRKRRSPEMIAQLVFEAERRGNAAEICRREGVAPTLFYRWRDKAKQGAIAALKEQKRGPRKKNLEEEAHRAEIERLRTALVEQSVELQLLKKSGI